MSAQTPPQGDIDPAALAQAWAMIQAQQGQQASQVAGQAPTQMPVQAPMQAPGVSAPMPTQAPTGGIPGVPMPEAEAGGKGRRGRKNKPPKDKGKGKDKKKGGGLSTSLKRAQTYGGKRRYLAVAVGAVAASTALSLLSLLVAGSAVTKDDVASVVADQLEAQGASFPSGQAVQWAGQVVRTLYTWDEDAKDDYAAQVSQFMSAGMDANAGWNGRGHQQVTFVSVNPEPQVLDATHAIVTAAYQIQDGSWACTAVPVFANKPSTFGKNAPWAFTLSALPTPSACTPRTGLPDLPKAPDDGYKEDQDTAEALADFFQSFFAAWAASDDATLKQYTTDSFTTIGLGGAMTSTPPPTITDITMLVSNKGTGDQAKANVTVTWTRPGSQATLTTTYTVPMTKVGSKWLVSGEPAPQYQATSGDTQPIPHPADDATPVPYDNPNTTSSKTPQASSAPTETATEGDAAATGEPTQDATSEENK